MPADNATPAPQQKTGFGGHRSTSSIHSQTTSSPSTITTTTSTITTPPPPPLHPQLQQHPSKPKGHKHVVSTGRLHSRVSSGKTAPRLTRAHTNDGSYTDMKRLTSKNSSSATNLKKNSSHANLRRNRSSADVTAKKTRDEHLKRPVSVHFEIGDQDKDEGWEEASSTASPTLSRSVSRSAASSKPSSAKPSAANSQQQSPVQAHAPATAQTQQAAAEGSSQRRSSPDHSTDGRIITERLLQRTLSHNTTKMSLATATPTSAGYLPDDMSKSQDSAGTASTPKIGSKGEVVSRFVGGSGTPSDGSPFLHTRKTETQDSSDGVKRVRSTGNLTNGSISTRADDDESALIRRSRHPSQAHAYIPPQQSRTQQKLWLQRASSNIEPQQMQMAPGAIMGGLAGLHGSGSLGGPSLVDADDDGRDPRTRIQLERTGLEYLVVRRHQDPVGAALRRLERLPGMEKFRSIPGRRKGDDGTASAGAGRHRVSQSLKDTRVRTREKGAAGSAEGDGGGSYEAQSREREGGGGEDAVTSLLRSIWDKSFDLSASTE